MTDTYDAQFLWVKLDPQVTRDFCSHRGRSRKCYAVLHRNGSYLTNAHGPIVAPTWATAIREANIYGGSIIAIFHEEKIKFARPMPNGGVAWERVIFTPDPDTVRALTSSTAHKDTTHARTQAPRKAQPSGAQKRRRRAA